MNVFSVTGRVSQDAVAVLVKEGTKEIPMISFQILDTGVPFKKNDPIYMEVHFLKEAAMGIKNYLVKNKEISVVGTMKYKKFQTSSGLNRGKLYLDADYIQLIGDPPNQTE